MKKTRIVAVGAAPQVLVQCSRSTMISHPACVNASDKAPASVANAAVRRAPKPPVREREADWVWGQRQVHAYGEKLEAAQAKRERRLVSERRRREKKIAAGEILPAAPEGSLAHAVELRVRTADRLRNGYCWNGGAVAGNAEYQRAPFTHLGFASAEHPILLAFVSRVRRRKHLRVGGCKSESYVPDSKLHGLDEPYVEANSRVCSVLRVELDDTVSTADVEAFCRAHGKLLPNVIVGWRDRESRYVRPHLLWLLHEGVPLEGDENRRFRGLFRGVLRGLVQAFLPLGADPGGLLNAHRHKNPLSPLWSRTALAEQPYDLSALALCVDTTVAKAALERMASERRGPSPAEADHPEAEVAVGSNRVFRQVADYAREIVGPMKAAGAGEVDFAAEVLVAACAVIGDVSDDAQIIGTAAQKLAKLVSSWTWNVYRSRAPREALTPVEVRERLQDGGRAACAARKKASLQLIGWVAQTLLADGKKLRQADILALVESHGIRSLKTVGRHLPDVKAALAAGQVFPLPAALAPARAAAPCPPVPAFLEAVPAIAAPRAAKPAIPVFLRAPSAPVTPATLSSALIQVPASGEDPDDPEVPW